MNNYKGGYKIVDLGGVNLGSATVLIAGIFDKLNDNYGKPILLTGIKLNNVAMDDTFTTVIPITNGVKLNCYNGYINVSNENRVSYVVVDVSSVIQNVEEDITTLKGDLIVESVNAVYSTLQTVGDDTMYIFGGDASKTGYTPIGIVGVNNNNSPSLALYSFELNSSNINVMGTSKSSGLTNIQPMTVNVLYRKSYS